MIKKTVNKLIGSILIEWGLIDQKQLNRALEVYNKREGQSLIGEILVELGFVKDEDIIKAFKIQYTIPYINIKGYEISREVTNLVPVTLARKYKLIPIDKLAKNSLTITMANPLNNQAINEVKAVSGCSNIQVCVSTAVEINEAINKYYPESPINVEFYSAGSAGEDTRSKAVQPAPGESSAENTMNEPTSKNEADIKNDEKYFYIKGYEISREVINLVPVTLARKYKLIPLAKLEDCIAIAMANPLNNQAINEAKKVSDCNDVLVYVATLSEINEAIDKYYHQGNIKEKE